MLYLRNLRERLQQRRNRLYGCGRQTYKAELLYFIQFLNNNRFTSCLIEQLNSDTSVNFDEWSENTELRLSIGFPDTEMGRAKVCYAILESAANGDRRLENTRWIRPFLESDNINALYSGYTNAYVDPLVNFILDEIDDAGNILYLLERIKFQLEWFRREALHCRYRNRTRDGEKNLDSELRACLFDGGVDFPFSQPLSPSGQADVVALLDSDDPLVLEVKVYDPENGRRKDHIRQGFHQITRYADNYNKSVGYLVIFNCSNKQLVFNLDDSSESEFPPRIQHASKTFFIIPIDIHPDLDSASTESPSNRDEITLRDLIRQQC